jgi:hypothetical protein
MPHLAPAAAFRETGRSGGFVSRIPAIPHSKEPIVKHRRFVIALLVALGLAGTALASVPAIDLSGTWTGTFQDPHGNDTEYVFKLTKSGATYTGFVSDSKGFVPEGTPIKDVKTEGGRIAFSFTMVSGNGKKGDLRFDLAPEGDKLVGQFLFLVKGAGAGAPIEFVRKKAA